MAGKIVILVLCVFIFSFFGAMAYIALDVYEPDYTASARGLGKVIVAAIKLVSGTIGDKVTAGILLALGAGAVGYFLYRVRKDEQAKG